MSPNSTAPSPQDCWNEIGVFGDRSCDALAAAVHCRNCQVFSSGGRRLLDRRPPPGYLQDWTRVLAHGTTPGEAVVSGISAPSLMIFRLADEFFALPVAVLLEVSSPLAVHTVPHRTTDVFQGLVNIRGELMLTASLKALLGVSKHADGAGAPRLAVARSEQGPWVFPLDEIFGIHPVNPEGIRPAPTTGQGGAVSCTAGLFSWRGHTVALLDPERIFSLLHQSLIPS